MIAVARDLGRYSFHRCAQRLSASWMIADAGLQSCTNTLSVCSTPFGIVDDRGFAPTAASLAYNSAQRLSASWMIAVTYCGGRWKGFVCSTPFGIVDDRGGTPASGNNLLCSVLNAFRQRG